MRKESDQSAGRDRSPPFGPPHASTHPLPPPPSPPPASLRVAVAARRERPVHAARGPGTLGGDATRSLRAVQTRAPPRARTSSPSSPSGRRTEDRVAPRGREPPRAHAVAACKSPRARDRRPAHLPSPAPHALVLSALRPHVEFRQPATRSSDEQLSSTPAPSRASASARPGRGGEHGRGKRARRQSPCPQSDHAHAGAASTHPSPPPALPLAAPRRVTRPQRRIRGLGSAQRRATRPEAPSRTARWPPRDPLPHPPPLIRHRPPLTPLRPPPLIRLIPSLPPPHSPPHPSAPPSCREPRAPPTRGFSRAGPRRPEPPARLPRDALAACAPPTGARSPPAASRAQNGDVGDPEAHAGAPPRRLQAPHLRHDLGTRAPRLDGRAGDAPRVSSERDGGAPGPSHAHLPGRRGTKSR